VFARIITNPDIAGPCLQYPIHNQGCKGGSQVQTVKTRWTHPEEKCLSLSLYTYIYIIRYNYLDRDTLVKSSRFSDFNSIQKQYQPRICHSLNCASLWFCAIPARYSPLTPPHSPNLKVWTLSLYIYMGCCGLLQTLQRVLDPSTTYVYIYDHIWTHTHTHITHTDIDVWQVHSWNWNLSFLFWTKPPSLASRTQWRILLRSEGMTDHHQ